VRGGHPPTPVVLTRAAALPPLGKCVDSRTIRFLLCGHPWIVRHRILIVDDHPSFRSAARLLLEHEGFNVIGEAEDGASGLAASARLRPDVVLLDVNLPDIDGFDVASRLCLDGQAQVVLTSSRDPREFGPLVSRSGARGFIPKGDLTGAALSALL
jgi:DNA-binding NarL/FixJ family response regulator